MTLTRSILANLTSLFIAVALAVIIWLSATQIEDPIIGKSLQIPLSYINQPENSSYKEPDIPNVFVSFKGPQSVVRLTTVDDFSATIDLSQAVFGQETELSIDVNTTADDIDAEILVNPSTIHIQLEQQITREIPVVPDIRGTVGRGHRQGIPLIEPPTITVSGPESQVSQLLEARVTVFLDRIIETTIDEYQPVFYDQQRRPTSTVNMQPSTEKVTVTIPVEEAADFAEKVITVDLIGEPASGYRQLGVTVEPASVLLQGSPSRLTNLTRLQTEPIDITGLTESLNQEVTLNLPDGVTLDQDQEIIVTVKIEPILTSDVRFQPVEILGLSETITATVTPENIRVVLFGPLPALETLLEEDVRVTVDVFGLEPGVYSLEPVIDLPDRGIEVRSTQPNVVSVTVTEVITGLEEVTDNTPFTKIQTSFFKQIKTNYESESISCLGGSSQRGQINFIQPDCWPSLGRRFRGRGNNA